uniref:Serpin domain-containing protein n=1 Tax=Tanacetum cinerariifolium TaxID=118510 RepID=A0A699H0U0_TANCI|nr:hypothetical protein [Tanacetum cinerariifolium]
MAGQSRRKKQKATTISNKTIGVATKILLDDANNGFKNGNFVCSPFSFELVLGMLAFGAERKDFETTILLDTGKGGPDVRLANGVWVDEGVKCVKSCYHEHAESAVIINSWVKEKTNGLIPNIIGGLTPDDVIIIANALYFKGTWSKPFSSKNTKKKDFHLINGEKVSVPFMTSDNEFDCGSFESYQMIKFSYESIGCWD